MKKMLFLMLFLIILGAANVTSQVRIGGNGVPHNAAVLDLNATDAINNGNLGLALPRVSLDTTNTKLNGTTPVNGMVVYNSNASMKNGNGVGLYIWSNNKWNALVSTTGGTSIFTVSLDTLNTPINGATPATGTIVWNTNANIKRGNGAGLYVWNGRWHKLTADRISGTIAPNASAVLDLNYDDGATPANNWGGLALPRIRLDTLDSKLNNATPINGTIVWNTNASMKGGNGVGLYVWNGRWHQFVTELDKRVRLGGTTTAAHASAILDLNASTASTPALIGGLALPRVEIDSATQQLNGVTPQAGTLVYSTTITADPSSSRGLYYYLNGWHKLKEHLTETNISNDTVNFAIKSPSVIYLGSTRILNPVGSYTYRVAWAGLRRTDVCTMPNDYCAVEPRNGYLLWRHGTPGISYTGNYGTITCFRLTAN